MSYYKLVGTNNPHTIWNSEVILAGAEEGETLTVKVGDPVELTEEQKDKVQSLGFVVEEASQEEVEAHEADQDVVANVGSDVSATGPVFEPAKSSTTRKENE